MDDAREPSWLLKVDLVEVVPSPVKNRHEYIRLEEQDVVQKILYEVDGSDPVVYEVRFGDTHTEMVGCRRPSSTSEAVLYGRFTQHRLTFASVCRVELLSSLYISLLQPNFIPPSSSDAPTGPILINVLVFSISRSLSAHQHLPIRPCMRHVQSPKASPLGSMATSSDLF